jgi:hypothetical protein
MKSANENLGRGIGWDGRSWRSVALALLARTGADQADDHQRNFAPQVGSARRTEAPVVGA